VRGIMKVNFLAAAALFAVVVACRAEEKKDANVVKVDPEEFAAEVKKDEKAAAAKYKGKLIETSGKVVSVVRGGFGGGASIRLPSKTAGIRGVSCFLKEENVFGKVVKGQEVTVRGRYPDKQYGFQIEDCDIVKKGPSPALTYTADEFVAEWAKDRRAAAEKWKDKPIIVSGLIIESKASDVGAVNHYLKAAGKQRVDCGFTAFEKELATKMTPGQTITVVGEFYESESKEGEPALRFCMPVAK